MNSDNSSLEKAYQNVDLPSHSFSGVSLLSIENSLSVFERYDDIYGQWLANYHIANYWIYHNKLELANKFGQKALNLAKLSKDIQALFKSTFQLAQLTKDFILFEKSLKYTSNVVERALVLTHLHKHQQAYDLIKSDITEAKFYQNNSIAFILFHYAQENDLENLIMRSKQLYVKAENSNGVIDCLFWLAKYHFKKKNILLANQFAHRAEAASVAIKNRYKTKKIKLWMDNHL